MVGSLIKYSFFQLILLTIIFVSCQSSGKLKSSANISTPLKVSSLDFTSSPKVVPAFKAKYSPEVTFAFAQDSSLRIEEPVLPRRNKEEEKRISKILLTARSYTGTPYKRGGMDKTGMDCSGLVNISYKEAGIVLPRTTSELCIVGTPVNLDQVEKGDLLFFATKRQDPSINHVGIVSRINKEGRIFFIHASFKRGVIEDTMEKKYFRDVFVKAIRPY